MPPTLTPFFYLVTEQAEDLETQRGGCQDRILADTQFLPTVFPVMDSAKSSVVRQTPRSWQQMRVTGTSLLGLNPSCITTCSVTWAGEFSTALGPFPHHCDEKIANLAVCACVRVWGGG